MGNVIEKKYEHKKGILALVLLTFFFASMGLFARYLSTGLFLFQQVYLRMLAAFLVGYIVFFKQINISKFRKLAPKEWLLIVVRAVSYSLFGIILFTQAILITKYSNVSFISSLPMTAFLGFVLLQEVFSFKKLFWILLAFAGVALISVEDYSKIFFWSRGEILTLISTVFFSLNYIARKWQTKKLNNKELTVINFLVAFLVVFIVSIVKGDGLPVSGWHPGLLLAVVGAGVFNICNVYLTNYGFQKVQAVLASNILTLESVFAVILGFLFYKEVPTLKELAGGIIIGLSVIGMNNIEAKK